MTDYSYTTNIRLSSDSDTRNVNTADSISVLIYFENGLTITNRTNCEAFLENIEQDQVDGDGQADLKIRFTQSGSYSCTVTSFLRTPNNTATTRTYTISGTASGAVNGPYGLEFYDTFGNTRLSVKSRVPRIHSVKSGTAYATGYDSSAQQDLYTYTHAPGVWSGSVTDWQPIEVSDSCNWYIDESYKTANKIRLRRNITNTLGAGTSSLDGSNSFTVIVLKY